MSVVPGFVPVVDAPGADPLQIGPVTFNSVEAPSALPIGALEKRLVTSEYIGGGKQTQDMGTQPKPVAWRGAFFQPNVDSRVTALLALMKSRDEVLLVWRFFRFYCRVKDFTPTWRHANICDYDISLEITRDAGGTLTTSSAKTVDSQVADLASNAKGQNAIVAASDPKGSQAFQQALNKALTAIQQYAPVAQLLAPQLTGLIQTVSAASSAVQTYGTTVNQNASHWVATQQLVTSLNLIAQNIQQGQSVKTVRVQGMDMMELAAMYYGDVTLATQVMQANGMMTPYTSAKQPTDVVLPPLQSSQPS